MYVIAGKVGEIDPERFLDDLREIGANHQCIVQVFDTRFVVGEAHLSKALQLSERARERERMIADDPAMELLLYVAGTRQIERATEIGLRPETNEAVVVVAGERESEAAERVAEAVGEPADHWKPSADEVREWFEVTPVEERSTGASLSELVRERGVLLQLEA